MFYKCLTSSPLASGKTRTYEYDQLEIVCICCECKFFKVKITVQMNYGDISWFSVSKRFMTGLHLVTIICMLKPYSKRLGEDNIWLGLRLIN